MTQFTLLPDANSPVHKVSPTDILQGLNEVQQEAVKALEGAVLIVAGPGSG